MLKIPLSFALLICTFFAFAQKGQSKIEAILFEKGLHQKQVECLVILHEQADISAAARLETKDEKAEFVFSTLKKHAQKTQLRLVDFFEKEKIEYRKFLIVNAFQVKTNIENLRKLADIPEVAAIADNPWVHFQEPVSAPSASDEGARTTVWGIQKIKADSVWLQGNKGQAAVIGGQDTGYQWDHPALEKSYRGTIDSTKADHNYNWHDAIHDKSPLSKDSLNPCGFNLKAPCDDQQHGTHTMGTMVGDDGLGNQIGVAPEARWIACRNMERGNGSPATYIEGFEWFLAPTDSEGKNPNPKKAPHVINNSWYCSPEEGCNSAAVSAIMEIAVKNLKASGVVVVISAGNFGSNCGTVAEAASSFESALTVGATNIDDNIGGFSSRGPKIFGNWKTNYIKPNVSAPGLDIRSCVPGNQFANGWNGTSMAGPHVAGVVALIITANPKLAGKVETIEDIIETTATKLFTTDTCGGLQPNVTPNFTFGFGRIDAFAAVKKAKNFVTNTNEIVDNTLFNVYPNPANELLNITSKDNQGDIEITVYDALGKKVLFQNEKNKSNIQLNISSLQIGSYFYEIKKEQTFSRGKFIKL